MQRWQCRVAPSLGDGFAGTPEKVWNTVPYTDLLAPTVFFGMYGFKDFQALWNHKGIRVILWAGSDITNMLNGYWLDDTGEIKLDPMPIARWIHENALSYVENVNEMVELENLGIHSMVVPSFLGNKEDYSVEYKQGKPRFYTSVSGNDFALYGWHEIPRLAHQHPDVEFHLYGNTKNWFFVPPAIGVKLDNIFVHGRMTQDEMNAQIKTMTGALRLTKHDGFSEILAKSILWGQYPVSPFIEYPHINKHIYQSLDRKEPNIAGRDYYLEHMNAYPWNKNHA